MKITFGKTLLQVIAVLCASLTTAHAYTYTCTGQSGHPTKISGSFGTVTISDTTLNVVGQVFDHAASWNTGSRIRVRCDEPSGSRPRRFTASSPLVPTTLEGTTQWFNVNEYLDTTINVAVQGNRYVPFRNVKGGSANDVAGNTSMPAGTTGFLDLKIIKPFVGTTSFDNIHVADIFLSKQSGVYSPEPIAQVFLNGVISVPQNCSVNAGAVIHVDFGTMYNTDFTAAGQKADNVTPQTFSVPVECNYGASLANLSLSLKGTATANGDAIQSDNPDVGVAITNQNSDLLRPNDDSSSIPLALDQIDTETFSTNVMLSAYPVSTTGNAPAEGTFTALAVLRVDFS
jgi:hypothetical protein